MYLDFYNNFLTIEKFASYHNISVELAEMIIKEGRDLHNAKAA